METQDRQDFERSRAMLGLMESLEQDSVRSQRSIALQFGVAVGLVNAYLKSCIKKGYVKVRRLPSRRYAYLLTPSGLAEKARLSLLHLSNELERFRRARGEYTEVFSQARQQGWQRVVLLGACELAEICALCALEARIEIVAIVDAARAGEHFIGAPVAASLAEVTLPFDGAILTEVSNAAPVFHDARARLGANCLLAPAFYGFAPNPRHVYSDGLAE